MLFKTAPDAMSYSTTVLGPPFPVVSTPLPYPTQRCLPSAETARSSGFVAPAGGVPGNTLSVYGGIAVCALAPGATIATAITTVPLTHSAPILNGFILALLCETCGESTAAWLRQY